VTTPNEKQPVTGLNPSANDDAKGKTPSAARPAAPKKGGGKKMTRRLVVLSAAAILSVYATGYVLTAPAAAQVNAQMAAVTASAGSVASGATATATTGYKDGTYTGTGTSRHGDVQAQVSIQGGRIVSAQITQSSTRYPISRIASLPGEVVAQQSPNVDMVSGATDSSSAYLAAVSNALSQAT